MARSSEHLTLMYASVHFDLEEKYYIDVEKTNTTITKMQRKRKMMPYSFEQ